MMMFLFTPSISRLHIRDQQPSEHVSAKFGPVRRRLHLQDAVDDADDGVPAEGIDLPTSDS